MTKSHTISIVLALVTAVAVVTHPDAQAASSTIFDTFDANEGHFNQWPGYSGSTVGITSASTADRVTTAPIEGAGCERLVIITNGAASIRVRFLSGLGTPANNVAFTTSSATDGWIGCFVKTTNTGWNVQLWLEGASNNGGIPKDITADGEWHVYEWNLEDTSGAAPDGWGSIAGITSGVATVADGSHTIDSILFRNTTAEVQTNVIFMDFVARYSDGSISNLVNQPCLTVPNLNMTGPLSTNENIVRVTGVSSSATNITIYQGSSGVFTNLYSIAVSSPAATVNVTVPAGKLVKGAQVAATQTIAGQEGCTPTSGVAVGGGASPRIKIGASIAQPGGVAGPVGRNAGGTAANMYWIHATGSSVAGGYAITPSTNWQTIAFYPSDSKYLWYGTFTFPDPNQYGIFEGFGIASADTTDSGPIQIYFDNFRQVTNGVEVVVQDFEGNANGVNTVLFYQPSFSSTTGGGLLAAPNASVISSTVAGGYASTGTNSIRVNFQFASAGSPVPWLRLCAYGPNGNPATPYPVVDLTQPILVDVLLLPVGQTASHALGRISPVNSFYQTNCPGTSASFAVQVTPPDGATPAYTYQWRHNASDISGATDSSYTRNNLSAADAGTYSVTVSDGIASATLACGILTVPTAVQIDMQPADNGVQPDGTGYANFSAQASIPALCPCDSNPNISYRWMFNGAPLSNAGNISGATGSGVGPVYPSLTISPTYYANAGDYTLVVTNTCTGQSVTSSVARLWVTPNEAVVVACPQSGLLDLDYTNQPAAYPPNPAFTGSPAATNAIMGSAFAPVDYDWITDSFGYSMGQFLDNTNHFRIRFVGTFQPPYDPGTGQLYTFYTRSDDGNRLWVNGQLVIDKWVNQGATTTSGSILLTTNAPVEIILEYFENTGNASVQLAYSSLSVPSNTIPATQLCAAIPGQTGGGGIPPMITLTSPTNNATVALGAPVTLAATVTPHDGTISKVEFYNNGTTLIATVPGAGPTFTTSWTPLVAGTNNITARVTYNTSSTLNTPVNKLTVAVPQSPVTISSITPTTVTYSGGGGLQFVLLKSASVTAPLSSWTRMATNAVTPGSFSISPAPGPAFYSIKSE